MSVNNNWSIIRLQFLLNNFFPDDIYNLDENGFYYQDEYLCVSEKTCYLVKKI